MRRFSPKTSVLKLARIRSAFICPLLEAQVTQSWVAVRTATERPVIFAICFQNGKIVDAGKPEGHEAVLIKFPVLIAIGAKPVTRIIVPLVSEAYRDAVP